MTNEQHDSSPPRSPRRRLRGLGRRVRTHDFPGIYYASDVHGADTLWRKFLGAGRFYGVDTLIMGGDLTGKAIVPVVRKGGGFEARFLGETRSVRSSDDLEPLLAAIRANGMYPWIADPDEVAEYAADPSRRDALFEDVITQELRRWVNLADERLATGNVRAYVISGNDDGWFVDDVLRESSTICVCDEDVVQVGEHEMISSSFANRTPWNSERELDESDLYDRLRALADQVERVDRAIFNFHVPPFNSGLDLATKIDSEFRVVLEAGSPTEVPVGSTAVRQILEEYQPLLALHGHIHESRGVTQIGRTLALNSGSEYNSGRIHGAVVRLSSTEIHSHQFVVG